MSSIGIGSAGLHSISKFISGFNGGTRPNRFIITATRPGGKSLSGPNGIHAMATTLPESTVGTIPIPFRGRIYKFPGDRDYQPWQVTFLDDVGNNDIYYEWHAWSEKFNGHYTNVSGSRKQTSNYTNIQVQLLDHNSDLPVRTFTLYNAWPMQVGPLELNMATNNQVSTFSCQIAYSTWSFDTGKINIT